MIPRDPEAVDAVTFEQRQAERVAAQAERIQRELEERGDPVIARGAARPVVREDGIEYLSVSEAAEANGVDKVDNICQAIQRQGKCGGWRWAYKGEEPEGFYVINVKRAAEHVGCWPRYRSLAVEVN